MHGLKTGVVADGMERLWNMIVEDGVLVPLRAPKPTGVQLPAGWRRIIGRHTPPGGDERLLYVDADGNLAALDMASGSVEILGAVDGEIASYAAIGNVIAVSAASGLCYFIHDGSGYHALGSRPPFPEISFALTEEVGSNRELTASTVISEGGAYLAGEPLRGTPHVNGPRTAEGRQRAIGELTDHVMGLINKGLRENVDECGLFAYPFFVRYAWRLADGTHAWHSAPVLMCPSMHAPEVTFDGSFDGEDASITSAVRFRAFRLDYRMAHIDTEKLAAWRNLLTAIDVYVSPAFYPFDVSGEVTGSWQPAAYDDEYDGTYKALHTTTWQENLYGDGERGDATRRAWRLPPNEAFDKELTHNSLFYKVGEIKMENIVPMTQFAPFPMEEKNLTILRERELLPDDFQSHAVVGAGAMLAYNSRLYLGDVEWKAPMPLPVGSMLQHCDGETTQTTVIVELKKGGRRLYVSREMAMGAGTPRLVWYPDPDAVMMTIGTHRYPLRRHEGLHGAWGRNEAPSATVPMPERNAVSAIRFADRVMTSGVDSPFVFPAQGVAMSGSGKVLAMSAAALPMSAGQFGQYPIYAFTGEGVVAMDIGAEGWVTAVRPVAGDILLHRESVAGTPYGVMFLTAKGLMLMEGAKARCLSAALLPPASEEPTSLPQMDAILTRKQRVLPPVDFAGLLKRGATIGYDYVTARLVVYSPREAEAYVYSCRSGEWSMMHLDVAALAGEMCILGTGDVARLFEGSRMEGGFLTRTMLLSDYPAAVRLRRVVAECGTPSEGTLMALWVSMDGERWRLQKGVYGHSMDLPAGSGVRKAIVMMLTRAPIYKLIM